MKSLVEQFKAARRVSTPLVAITTSDQAATISMIVESINGKGTDKEPVLIHWDAAAGTRALNEKSAEHVAKIKGEGGYDNTFNNPGAFAIAIKELPEGSIAFIVNAHRWMHDAVFVQAVWNLRDRFKQDSRMLVMLAPSIDFPAELAGDVVVFDEPLPGSEALTKIIREVHGSADLKIDDETMIHAVEAVQGLPAFQAEQVTAMSLTKKGVELGDLWERKRQQIELTPGLKVQRDGVKFNDIGGVSVIKGFLRRVIHGQGRPNAVVFLDEIEKQMSGATGGGGDQSGVSQDQLGAVLTYMQDHGAIGAIFVGPPGSAKSMVAKATGNEGGIPTIQLDLGAAKGSLVGQSEQQIRGALKVITAVSNGKSLWIATCNKIADLPPELRRRFTLGTFFFDLPTAEEREAIWELHTKAFKFRESQVKERPTDTDWTGAEIRQCCDLAWRLQVDLKSAAKFVLPVAISARQQIEGLREGASGKFLSASREGIYSKRASEPATDGPRKSPRAVAME